MRLFNDTQNIDVYNANRACLSAHFIWSISHSNCTGNWGIQWQALAVGFICMRSVLFWDSTQLIMVVLYRRFGKTCRSHLQGSSSISCIAEPLKVGPIRCFETSVRTYHSTARKIPKEGRYHSHRGGSLKSRIVYACVVSVSRLLRACCMLCPNHTLWCVPPNLMKCTNYAISGYTHELVKIHSSSLYHILWVFSCLRRLNFPIKPLF